MCERYAWSVVTFRIGEAAALLGVSAKPPWIGAGVGPGAGGGDEMLQGRTVIGLVHGGTVPTTT